MFASEFHKIEKFVCSRGCRRHLDILRVDPVQFTRNTQVLLTFKTVTAATRTKHVRSKMFTLVERNIQTKRNKEAKPKPNQLATHRDRRQLWSNTPMTDAPVKKMPCHRQSIEAERAQHSVPRTGETSMERNTRRWTRRRAWRLARSFFRSTRRRSIGFATRHPGTGGLRATVQQLTLSNYRVRVR